MKFTSTFLAFAAVFSLHALHAQQLEESKEVKVEVKSAKVEAQSTPKFNVDYVTDKRWKPRTWLELDVTFDAKLANVPGAAPAKLAAVDSLEFRYYIGLNKADSAGKYIVLTGNITYLNIPEKEVQHALAFVSPAELTKALEKTTFSPSDVKAIGLEIVKNGLLAGGYSSAGGRWWDKTDSFVMVDGAILQKAKTPFAPLWGDYDADTKN